MHTINLDTLATFFGWNIIIAGALLLFMTLATSLMPNIAYRLQSKFFDITRDQYTITIYRFLAQFKLMLIVFFVVPYIALCLMK